MTAGPRVPLAALVSARQAAERRRDAAQTRGAAEAARLAAYQQDFYSALVTKRAGESHGQAVPA